MQYNITKKLGVGSVGDAYLLDNGKVIIVGKREDSFENYKVMYKKMKIFEDKITIVNYPKIYDLVQPCKDYPFGAVVEEYVVGEELRKSINKLDERQREVIGQNLAKFIVQIHNIKCTGNKVEEININLSKYDKSLRILKDYLSSDVYEELISIREEYKSMLESKEFCLTHGDLNAGNIMIDDGKVSGIIDFGNMEYYIPEIEFVHLYFFDKVIFDAMVLNYPKNIDEKEIVFLELVVTIRHFKNIVNFEDRKTMCLHKIEELLVKYLDMKKVK